MLNLGSLRLAAYEVVGFVESTEEDYAEHAVVEGTPVLQHIGAKLKTLSVSVVVDVKYCDPQKRTDEIKALYGGTFHVSAASGTQYGKYVLISAPVTAKVTAKNGRLLSATLQLELKEYQDNASVEEARRQKAATAPARERVGSENKGSIVKN